MAHHDRTKDLIHCSGAAEQWRALYRNLWSREEVFRYLFSRPCATEETARRKTAAWCNIRSVRNAIRCGFRPAWVELTARDKAFVEEMNG